MPRFLGIGRDKLELKRVGIKSSNAGFIKNLWPKGRHYVYQMMGKNITIESSNSEIVDISKEQLIQLSNGYMSISFHKLFFFRLAKNKETARLFSTYTPYPNTYHTTIHQCMRDPVSPHPHQHLELSLFFILAVFNRCLIMTSHQGLKYLFMSFIHFLTGLLVS